MDFMDRDRPFVFDPKDPRSNIYVEVYDGIVPVVSFEALLEFGRFADSMAGPDGAALLLLLFFCSSSSEISAEDQVCWKNGYDPMRGGTALAALSGLGRRFTHPESWLRLCPFVVIDPTDLGATIADSGATIAVARAW